MKKYILWILVVCYSHISIDIVACETPLPHTYATSLVCSTGKPPKSPFINPQQEETTSQRRKREKRNDTYNYLCAQYQKIIKISPNIELKDLMLELVDTINTRELDPNSYYDCIIPIAQAHESAHSVPDLHQLIASFIRNQQARSFAPLHANSLPLVEIVETFELPPRLQPNDNQSTCDAWAQEGKTSDIGELSLRSPDLHPVLQQIPLTCILGTSITRKKR